MLEYKKNRIDYGKQLNPPDGFIMDRAITSTYSLNLTAFLSITVALFYKRNLDEKVTDDRLDIFDAIQKTSDSISIYCQKGKMEVKENANRLISFIDESVIEILPDEAYKSFHPKLWVIRYKNPEKEILYRIIVLSRNLTFDRSWDIAFSFEGFVNRTTRNLNKPLTDYLKHLTSYGDFQKSNEFINDLSKVDFKIDAPFDGFKFHPIGFEDYTNPLINQKWEDLIIVSPFLHKNTLEFLSNQVSGEKYLFSRKEELDKIHLDILADYKVYAFSRSIVDGEEEDNKQEEAFEETMCQNLHAKLFIGTTQDNKTKWYLGSANCSEPAMRKNEEILIELTSGDNLTSVNQMLDELLAKEKDYDVFEEYNRENKKPVETDEYDFRPDIYNLLKYLDEKGNITIKCEPSSEDKTIYNIAIKLIPNDIFKSPNIKIFVSPFGWKGDIKIVTLKEEIQFNGIALYNLSPFFIWRIYNSTKDDYKDLMTRIDFKLPTERKEAVFRSIIQDKEHFMQLIQFLMGANVDTIFFQKPENRKKKGENNEENSWTSEFSMYEEMLISASRNPNKLEEIERLIERMKKYGTADLIPVEFKLIWDVFKQMIKNG